MRLRTAGPVGMVAVVVLGGCGLDVDYRTRNLPRTEAPGKLVTIDCPVDGKGIGGVEVRGGVSATGAPVGFTATTAVVCRPERRPGRGTVLRLTILVEQAPVTASLTSALQLPDRAFVDPDAGVCAAVGVVPPYLLLTDGRGRGYRPVLPVDECGAPRREVNAALDGLHRATVRSYQIKISS